MVALGTTILDYEPDGLWLARWDKEREIQWYTLRMEYSLYERILRHEEVDEVVRCPAGAAAAYVGLYGEYEDCIPEDDGHAMYLFNGLQFNRSSGVLPYPDDVMIPPWHIAHKQSDDQKGFVQGRQYVFCFDRKPVAVYENLAGKPMFAGIEETFDHLVSIVALEPAYCFERFKGGTRFYLTSRNLQLFVEKRSETVELQLAKRPDAQLALGESDDSMRAPFGLVEKVLYAWNSLTWKSIETMPDELGEPISVTTVKWVSVDGQEYSLQVGYHSGKWIATAPNGDLFQSYYPLLLYDAKDDWGELSFHHSSPSTGRSSRD